MQKESKAKQSRAHNIRACNNAFDSFIRDGCAKMVAIDNVAEMFNLSVRTVYRYLRKK